MVVLDHDQSAPASQVIMPAPSRAPMALQVAAGIVATLRYTVRGPALPTVRLSSGFSSHSLEEQLC